MKDKHAHLGKTAYGLLFNLIVPLLLITWAKFSAHQVKLPAIKSELSGTILSGIGLAIMLWGMLAIYIYGKGLPMNAYPPKKLVKESIYKYIAHPIYFGFCLICVGTSLFYGSASGLWLVSPVMALSCMALVWGYELIDLKKRFPESYTPSLFSIPPDDRA